MPRKEASTFQFNLCSIRKLGDSNFWVKICLALEESIFQVEWLIATLIHSGFLQTGKVVEVLLQFKYKY